MTLAEIHEKCADVYRVVLHDVISNQLNYRTLLARRSQKSLREYEKKKKNTIASAKLFDEHFDEKKKRILCIHDDNLLT